MPSIKGDIAIAITALALVGCAPKARIAERPAPPPVTQPSPPPAPSAPGPLHALNHDLSDEEAAWHLRSALNVAALSCDRNGKLGIASAYNQLLARQRKPLAAAYRAEGARFGGTGALDAHVTRVYNLFAQPPSPAAFCAAAAKVAAEAHAVPPERFTGWAPAALQRLVSPSPVTATPAVRMALATGQPWRIQLGAYSGDRAARGAWDKIRSRMRGVAEFTPHYEAVPDSQLVRIRIGPVDDRTQAIALCAAAAGAGLDCLPVRPKV